MLQETTTAPATGGDNSAAALQQMGFADMIQHLDFLGWTVLIPW
jgi:biopolymer transport protein ExbB